MKTTEFTSQLLGERYVKIDHPSGLPIYVFPKKLTSTYALFATRYGSVDNDFSLDGDEKTVHVPDGIAHFLEHKLFENEDGSDSFARFSDLGADANAYTTYDRTAYLFSCTEHFAESLEELLTFVTHPYFTPATVKKEQGIIAEEIRMYDDNPWERGFQLMLRSLYHRNAVRNNVCGSVASIGKITDRLLYDAYRVFYQLSNMVLVVCGDVDVTTVLEVAERVLPDHATPVRIVRKPPDEPESARVARASEKMQVPKPIFTIGFKDRVLADPDARMRRDAAMELLDEILFSRSGKFYNDLFEAGILTPSFSAGYSSTDSFAFHCISGEADDPERVYEELTAFLGEVRKTGIDREDFERCRRVLYADEIRGYDSTDEIANRLLCFALDGGDMLSYPELIESLTPEELNDLFREVYDDSRASMSVIEPLS